MARQVIDLTTVQSNGKKGEAATTAFNKINLSLAELYAWLGGDTLPAVIPVARGFARSNVLGSVSQASGVPTGALIESGSNVNGRYAKFADGTMICMGVMPAAYTTSSSLAAPIYMSGVWAFTFPVAFASVPYVTFGVNSASGNPCWPISDTTLTVNGGGVRAASCLSTATATISYVAHGRWF